MLGRLKTVFSLLYLLVAFCVVGSNTIAQAESSQSNNYELYESYIGTSDLNDSSSTSYQGSSATGYFAVGNSASSGYQIDQGTKTTEFPTLSVIINSGSVGFGNFSSTTPTVTTASFSVLNYTSYGYVVNIVGDPPKNGDYSIAAMATTGPSQIGTDQFGINMVANTSPSNFGANPNNGSFGFGSAATNYASTNQFRYVDGETIAQATKSSGKTDYTISYLINVNSLAPGGIYTCKQTLVATGTY